MSFGDAIVGAFVALLGVVGLLLVSGALDNAIWIFGMGLFAFAVLFNFGLVKKHFDRQEAAAAKVASHG